MEYTKLGNSNLNVSKLCLGCMGFGDSQNGTHSWALPYEESKEIIKYALDQGINFFDTAMVYQNGTSEEITGRILKELRKREEYIIATKIAPKGSYPEKEGISVHDYVEECLNNSLKRMQVDYIDLYILHWWDYRNPISEYLESFHHFIQQGKIKYIGISNCYAWQLAKANALAKEKGWEQFVSIQSHYNLVMREDERELIPYCKEDNIALTPYSPLAAGRLSRHPGETTKRSQTDEVAKKKYDEVAEQDRGIIERIEELSKKKGVSMAEISLAWFHHKNAIPVFAATKKSHIESAVRSVKIILTPEEIQYLEELYTPHKLSGNMAWNKSADSMFTMKSLDSNKK
ncbi:hypothetical protein M9Y10_029798 [Tritrichomonas musculus]|uniref:NADP-dependent oxidoreductase domain-containing protein n=1 Tax=Tritrichomonas musculus TaxID=1915356 RepID=A0ABR2KRF2_9EUKA